MSLAHGQPFAYSCSNCCQELIINDLKHAWKRHGVIFLRDSRRFTADTDACDPLTALHQQ